VPPPREEQCPAAQRTKSERLRVSATFLHVKAPGLINYNAPTEKSTTHVEGIDQLPRSEGNSSPRHTGVAEAAEHWRLLHKVYVLCSFCLKNCSVTSVTVQRAFLMGGGIPPRRLGNGGSRHLSRPRVRNCVPRCNEPSRTDCGFLRPSFSARHRAGSTTTHRPRKVPRTAREAFNYHATKERTVHPTQGSRRRLGIGGWDPRSMSYYTFV
jgi:hypothetical protein